MKNVKNWKKPFRDYRQAPQATRENKKINSDLTRSVPEECAKPEEPRMLTN
jgi:hypothetical protein